MDNRFNCILPLNRVEGDLEIHLRLDAAGTVRDARSVGTMYRGFENLMTGRAPLDALVITPRICGICTTAHLNAAAGALDMLYKATVPDNARRLRNVTLLVEQMQNDIRHAFLLFMPDAASPAHGDHPQHPEALRRYQPLKGETQVQAIAETQRLLEIIAILGGQWPHSSFMVPGGVVSVPGAGDINQCRHLLFHFRKWYESRILGCDLATFQAVDSVSDLMAWLEKSPAHGAGDLGFFIRFALAAGFDQMGGGHGRFISYGGPALPADTAVRGFGDDGLFIPATVCSHDDAAPLDPEQISEDVCCAYYKGTAPAHPFKAATIPDPDSRDPKKYSWAKAPRYGGRPAETGPLADLLAAGHPLVTDWMRTRGASVFVRQLARMIRPALVLPAVDAWLEEMASRTSPFYRPYKKRENGSGFGLVTAPRGALGHWIQVMDGAIANYQVITPTAWNGSPRDETGRRGPWEEALAGSVVADPEHLIEAEHVIRSFDPCMVCTVHAIDEL